jgi:hypothetical protein
MRAQSASSHTGLRATLFFVAAFCAVAIAGDVITRAQIEQDWLTQDALREKPAAAAAAKAPSAGNVTREQDAAGGVDGVKNGKWGFHTENEDNPWWQVDLGKATAIDRVALYNRCDDCGGRNVRILVLLSDDGKTFKQAYQHDGTAFYGHSDKKPLSAPLNGAQGRYLRLQLPAKSYFHLDEVEVYAAGGTENVALKKPATQSSTSEWSAKHDGPVAGTASSGTPAAATAYSTPKAIARGLQLAENLRGAGVQVDGDVAALKQVGEKLAALPADATDEAKRALHFEARACVRKLALRNPLLDFDAILFAKAAPGRFPHLSDQHYGWWSRPGGGIYILEGFKSDTPKLRCLTEDMATGSFLHPELSYDGTKVLFSYCKFYQHVADMKDKASKKDIPDDAFYHIYEMNLDGTQRRQITRSRYDDFDARYLPSGEIVFLSTRKGVAIQVGKASASATLNGDMPDCYVRCGGDNYRPVPVFTLHKMDANGGNMVAISAFENFEWSPAVANDGRIIYTRWDYIDRFNGHFFSLWSTNPDGTNPQLVYGNYTVRPQGVIEAVPIPGSHKLVFTASAHHSITGGSLCLLDRNRGTEFLEPLVRLTPEVPFPETEAWGSSYYANPHPLSEEHYLVCWSDKRLPPHCRVDDSNRNPVNPTGIYLYDAFGNLNLLYRDPELGCNGPIPVRARVKPPVYADTVAWDGPQEGAFLLQDVYQGLDGVARGSVKRLRVIGVPPKVQPHMNNPNLGVSAEDPGKFVLGTVPVEEDGSAHFRVPSGVPFFFQALDAKGMAVQTMRSLTYVQPKQTLSCVGCHESREAAPVAGKRPLAAAREPSKITPGPEGSWPLKFETLVQPVLDKSCVSCHKPGAENPKAAAFDLTPAKAYQNLLMYGGKDLHNLTFEKDRSLIGHCAAQKSKLMALLLAEKGHEGVKLDADSFNRLVTWMDVYAQRRGHYSDKQEEELKVFKENLAGLLGN